MQNRAMNKKRVIIINIICYCFFIFRWIKVIKKKFFLHAVNFVQRYSA